MKTCLKFGGLLCVLSAMLLFSAAPAFAKTASSNEVPIVALAFDIVTAPAVVDVNEVNFVSNENTFASRGNYRADIPDGSGAVHGILQNSANRSLYKHIVQTGCSHRREWRAQYDHGPVLRYIEGYTKDAGHAAG